MHAPAWGRRTTARAGHTFVELLVTMIVLSILASAILPVAEATRRREKEVELRRALRDLRQALVMYHQICLKSFGTGSASTLGQTSSLIMKIENDPGSPPTCYPKDLDVLVEGVETNIPDYTLRFLRGIPRDPFNIGDEEHDQHGWRLRSTTDRPEGNLTWDKRNVFDVASGSERKALDGSRYSEW